MEILFLVVILLVPATAAAFGRTADSREYRDWPKLVDGVAAPRPQL